MSPANIVFLGIVRELIGYVGTKDRDKDMAATILVVGVTSTT
jgi:hypothetical protein